MKISISTEERDLILEHAEPSPELGRKLGFGLLDGSILTFELAPAIVEDLLRCIDQEVRCAKDRKTRRRFKRLYLRVFTAAEQQSMDGFFGNDGSEEFPVDPRQAAEQLLSSRDFASMDEANSALAKLSAAHNTRPRDEFQGLSPEQVATLMYSDWTAPEEGLYCRDDLSLEQVNQSEILHNARVFLGALRDEQGAKATAKGNLNRKFVVLMVESMRWPNGYVEDLWRYNKVLDEEDVTLLHVLKIISEIVGLVRKYKGRFVVTRKGESFLHKDKAGALYALLFRTYLRSFNLGYTDGYEAYPSVQETIAYSLYVLRQKASDWRSIAELADVVFLPSVSSEFQPLSHTRVEEALLHVRLVRPLIRFGLIKGKEDADAGPVYPRLTQIRTTPLYAGFLQFT